MSRQPAAGDATWKGIAIIVGAIVLGLVVFNSFPDSTTSVAAGSQGRDQPKDSTTTTLKAGAAAPTTTTSIPLKDNKDVKVLVANATTTSGATKKVVDALKPACYAMQTPVDALAKVKSENRPTSNVYSTPGYEREAQLIANKLQLPSSALAALPPESPIPTKGQPSFNVLILVAKDLVDKPPEPLPGADCSTTGTTKAGTAATGAKTTTTVKRTSTTSASKITTTTRPITTTSRQPTTTAP
jgi:hypothetical protein